MIKPSSNPYINWSNIPPPSYNIDSFRIGNDADNRVLELGSSGSFDDVKIIAPFVVQNNGTIYLFYQGFNGVFYQAGVATATIEGFTGVNFTKYGSNPINIGGHGTILYDEDAGIWKAWHNFTGSIGYSTANSPFGSWTSYGSNPIITGSVAWEGSYLQHPRVWKEGTNVYKMLYTGGEVVSDSQVGLATSTDGISWTKSVSNPVISPSASDWWRVTSVFAPSIPVLQDGIYHILINAKAADGNSRCGYAYSTDLVTWIMGNNNPTLNGGRRGWEGAEVEYPNILQINDKLYIYYDTWYGTVVSIGCVVT